MSLPLAAEQIKRLRKASSIQLSVKTNDDGYADVTLSVPVTEDGLSADASVRMEGIDLLVADYADGYGLAPLSARQSHYLGQTNHLKLLLAFLKTGDELRFQFRRCYAPSVLRQIDVQWFKLVATVFRGNEAFELTVNEELSEAPHRYDLIALDPLPIADAAVLIS